VVSWFIAQRDGVVCLGSSDGYLQLRILNCRVLRVSIGTLLSLGPHWVIEATESHLHAYNYTAAHGLHCMSSNAAVSMYHNNALEAANGVGYKPSLTARGLDLLWHVCSPN
jgi:hypothetical protein